MPLTLMLIAAYLLGAVPTGLVVVRLTRGIDIRTVGSGNIGATNVVRAAGWGWGIATLLIDAIKGAAVPVAIGMMTTPPTSLRWQIAAGLLAILANLFNPFLRFKGGKGVGTAIGVTAVVAPLPLLIAMAAFAVAVALTRIVSVGSLSAGLALAISSVALYLFQTPRPHAEAMWYSVALCTVIFFTHRANIVRLLNGTERRLTRSE